MNFKPLVAVCLLCILLVGSVCAQTMTYQIQGKHQGTVTLDTNGSGVVFDGKNTIAFNWIGFNGKYVAWYWVWSVPFEIKGNKLTSSSFPEDVGVLQT